MKHLKKTIICMLAVVVLFSITGFSAPVLREENSSKSGTESEKTQKPAEKNGDIYILFTSVSTAE